jgi:hypothetical protein
VRCAFELPVGVDNLLIFDAISVRAAIDPLAPLNAAGAPQAFSVQVTDRSGATARVAVRADEPALRYPAGETQPDRLLRGTVHRAAPAAAGARADQRVHGVNLASIAEVALVFDQTESGSLFLADVELVRAPVSPRPTLSDPPSAELIAAAEAGDVEAMRQLANLYAPTEALGVQYGNLEQAIFWYRQACAAGTPTPRSTSMILHARTPSGTAMSLPGRSSRLPGRRHPPGTPQRHHQRRVPGGVHRAGLQDRFLPLRACSRGRNRILPISVGVLPTS